MRLTTEEREEGLSGRGGGEEDELEVAWGFAVEVEDAPVANSWTQHFSHFWKDPRLR